MKIEDGRIYLYYLFDIASEIRLEKLEKVFGRKPIESQFSYDRVTPKQVSYSQPPLLVKLGNKTKELSGKKFDYKLSAKIYDFGAISFRLSFTIPQTLDDLVSLSELLNENLEIEKDVKKELEKLKIELKEVLISSVPNDISEDYLVFHIKKSDVSAISPSFTEQNQLLLAQIIRSDSGNLSESLVKESLKNSLSYFNTDLTLVDWNCSIIFDSNEISDTLEIIEFANIELLELRVYDAFLEKELDEIYSSVDSQNDRPWFLLALSPFSPTIKKLEKTRLDVLQVIDKVENTVKLSGDPFLVKVYRTCSESFRVKEWKSNVSQKLEIMEDFYQTLTDRTQTDRLLLLEFLMLLIFLVEFILIIISFFSGDVSAVL